jgi:hypothetical protein
MHNYDRYEGLCVNPGLRLHPILAIGRKTFENLVLERSVFF